MRRFFILLVLLFATTIFTTAQAQTDFRIDPSMSASWYNPAESGHGVMIHLIDDEQAWMCWFTFDLEGNTVWICAQSVFLEDTIVFSEAFQMEGGKFPPLFEADKVNKVPWGSITIRFTDCNNAVMEWTTEAPGFQSGGMPLSRLTTLWGHICGVPIIQPRITIPRSEIAVTVDGIIGFGEWEDAIETTIVINEDWKVPVRLKNDGTALHVIFSKVSGPNDENRVNRAQDDTLFPELFIDITPDETQNYDQGNLWYHASFEDCHMAGTYADNSGCEFTATGWAANNWPIGTAGDDIEFTIPYAQLQLEHGKSHTIRLMATMTSSLTGNVVYHSVPQVSIPSQSGSWHIAELE